MVRWLAHESSLDSIEPRQRPSIQERMKSLPSSRFVWCFATVVFLVVGGEREADANSTTSSTTFASGSTCSSSPPMKEAPPPGLRLRTHVVTTPQTKWIGPDVPSFVPPMSGTRKLDLLIREDSTWVALYKDDFQTCTNGGNDMWRNCSTEARLFDCAGVEKAAVSLNAFMSRKDHLEVQDIHFKDNTLYFNEACQTYARDAGGKCSAMVAVDPFNKKLVWRTGSLISNNWFVLAGPNSDFIVTAYGFTQEPSSIRILRRKDGAVLDTKPLKHTNFEMHLLGSGDVVGVDLWHDIGRVHYKLSALDTASPKLSPMK